MYEVILYEDARGKCPVQELIDNLEGRATKGEKDARVQLKQIFMRIRFLENLGTRSSNDTTKHIEDGIWELRTGKNRILFFIWTDSTIVLLHAFRKTTNTTPKKEIDKAKRERNYWKTYHGDK